MEVQIHRGLSSIPYITGCHIYNFTASFSFDCSATCGLWLDADLYHGRTQHCDTFENEPLTGDVEDFIIRGIEIWSLNDEEYD